MMVVSEWDRPLNPRVRRGDPDPHDIPAHIHLEDGRVLTVDVRDLLPDGSVIVDRARVDRLREIVSVTVELEAFEPRHAISDGPYNRWRQALDALLPTDTDPLPE